MNPFKQATNSLFNRLGIGASYIDNDNTEIPIKVILKAPDNIYDIGDTPIHHASHFMNVRITDIKHPKSGDKIKLNNDIFIIQGTSKKDLHHLIWTLSLVKE